MVFACVRLLVCRISCVIEIFFFFFKQKTADEMRISDWSSDVCSSDLQIGAVQFLVTIPPTFARSLVRGERPVILVEADATDPAATSNAVADRKSVVKGKRVSVRVDLGGRRIINKTKLYHDGSISITNWMKRDVHWM